MNYHGMGESIDQAAVVMDKAEYLARKAIVKVAAGRLKLLGLPTWALKELKRELQNYDMGKGRWMR